MRRRHGGVPPAATSARGLRRGAPRPPLQPGGVRTGVPLLPLLRGGGGARSSEGFCAVRWGCSYRATQSRRSSASPSPSRERFTCAAVGRRKGTGSPICSVLLFLGLCPAAWPLPPPVLPVAGLLLPGTKFLAGVGRKQVLSEGVAHRGGVRSRERPAPESGPPWLASRGGAGQWARRQGEPGWAPSRGNAGSCPQPPLIVAEVFGAGPQSTHGSGPEAALCLAGGAALRLFL